MDGGLRALGSLFYDLIGWLLARIREMAYAPVMGRYHEYKGNPIDVHEEDDGDRWLTVHDVRRSLPALIDDTRLKALFPRQVRKIGEPSEWRIEARSLAALLVKAQDPETRRFLGWLQKVVIYPAQRKAKIARGGGG